MLQAINLNIYFINFLFIFYKKSFTSILTLSQFTIYVIAEYIFDNI